jgi:hypothetical protein
MVLFLRTSEFYGGYDMDCRILEHDGEFFRNNLKMKQQFLSNSG